MESYVNSLLHIALALLLYPHSFLLPIKINDFFSKNFKDHSLSDNIFLGKAVGSTSINTENPTVSSTINKNNETLPQ